MTGATTRNEPGQPGASPVFLVSWSALESTLSLLASPHRAADIPTTISALRRLPPEKLLVQMLSATAWLTSEETSSPDSAPASAS